MGTDRENGTAAVCLGAEFYFSGSSALPELREASPCTLHTYLLTLATAGHKTGGRRRTQVLSSWYLDSKQSSVDVIATENHDRGEKVWTVSPQQ